MVKSKTLIVKFDFQHLHVFFRQIECITPWSAGFDTLLTQDSLANGRLMWLNSLSHWKIESAKFAPILGYKCFSLFTVSSQLRATARPSAHKLRDDNAHHINTNRLRIVGCSRINCCLIRNKQLLSTIYLDKKLFFCIAAFSILLPVSFQTQIEFKSRENYEM